MASVTIRNLDEKAKAGGWSTGWPPSRSQPLHDQHHASGDPAWPDASSQGQRRSALEAAATSMFALDFVGRILGFGTDAAPAYAQIASDRRRAGRPISHFAAQIAAIARFTGASIATRNVADFDACGVTLIDPWNL